MKKLTITNRHGQFGCLPMALDVVIARVLPASVNQLRARLAEEVDPNIDWSDVDSVGEALVILASCTVSPNPH